MSAYDLIIFDCDGVLIESEAIAYRVESRLFKDLGANITPEEVGQIYSGTSGDFMINDVKERFGIDIDLKDFGEKFNELFWPMARAEMKATPGVIDFIAEISHDHCVCSNSSYQHIINGLEIVGIHTISEDFCFSAPELGRGKPAPDVYLHAAASFGARPDKCIVIEDSPSGVSGGVAAGMTVAGFVGGNHINETHEPRLKEAGASFITDDWSIILEHIG